VRRRNWLLDGRLALRAERAELIHLLRSKDVGCSVGPAEPGGWVVVAMDPGTDPGPLAAKLSRSVYPLILTTAVDTGKDRLKLRIWQHGSSAAEFDWRRGSGEWQGLYAIATAIDTSPSELPAEPGGGTAGELLERIVEQLHLPSSLTDRPPESALVLHRGELADVYFMAAVAGPTWLMATGSGWCVLVPADDPDVRQPASVRAVGLAAGLSSFSRQLGTIVIWHGNQNGCGYSLWHKGHAIDFHNWNSMWEGLPGGGVDDQNGNAAILAQAAEQPDHTVPLRALLRRTADPAELLGDFTSLTRIPTECAQLLLKQTTPDRLPGAQLVERTSPGRVADDYAMTPPLADSLKRRPLSWIMFALSIAAALFCGMLTLIGIAVLVTNGAFVEQPGRTAGDWWRTAVTAAVTAVATWSAVMISRRNRRA
jgi:hypothetical protein